MSKRIASILTVSLAFLFSVHPVLAAPITYDLSWQGDAGYTMTGEFSFDDSVLLNGPLITVSDLLSLQVNFFDAGAVLLDSYDLFVTGAFLNFYFDSDVETLRQGNSTGFFVDLSFGEVFTGWSLGADLRGAGFGPGYIVGLAYKFLTPDAVFVDGSNQNLVLATRRRAEIPIPGTVFLFGVGLIVLLRGVLLRRA